MTTRGVGDPNNRMASMPSTEWARRLGASPLKRMAASWSGPTWGQPNTRSRRDPLRLWRAPLGSSAHRFYRPRSCGFDGQRGAL